jgi:hypothetical protein
MVLVLLVVVLAVYLVKNRRVQISIVEEREAGIV